LCNSANPARLYKTVVLLQLSITVFLKAIPVMPIVRLALIWYDTRDAFQRAFQQPTF
jgi:hypothetical protein